MAKPPTQGVSEDAPAFVGAESARAGSGPVPAYPVEGDKDMAAMTRDVIARFPKIIAKLGE
jgi:hypothetical protein